MRKNRWFIAFIIATVVAVAAIVVSVVIALQPRTPDTSASSGGPEVGIYYYDVVDGEVLLTLSEGNHFIIAGPEINKTGTYQVDGSHITLDFFRDEDGTTTADMQGDSIALLYDGATLVFTRKVSYSVSFQTNGGSAVSSVSVVNGRTLAKPADPVRDGYTFLGWYTDAAFTTPFHFDVAAITADTVIYAQWLPTTHEQTEYTIDFQLGYPDAEAMDAITTVGGVAYGVLTPEREGYTFGGWWISMYEDGHKLTYAYTEEMVFTEDTTLFAVWHDNASGKLPAPAVSIKEDSISWDAVQDAVSYVLTVIDPDGNVVIDHEVMGATVKAFDFAGSKPGEYKITVTAVASDEEKNSPAAERFYANHALDRVSHFTVVNGILVFGAVENAQKYVLTIDCGNSSHAHTGFDNGASTNFYLGNCPMQEGGILITVTASANGYADSVSRVFVYNKVLDAVENLTYDAENDRFTWDAVTDAANYQVTVTVDGHEHIFQNGTSTFFSTAAFSGDITIRVIPVTEGYNAPVAATATCQKSAPATPDGLTVSDLTLSWNAVAGAASYEVNINGQSITVESNHVSLLHTSVPLNPGQVYTIKVKAITADNRSSSYSKAIETGYLVMLDSLRYAQNTVYWAPVLGVSEYEVRVNGGLATTVTGSSFAKVVLTREGENLIEVRYVTDESASEWVGITVTAYAVEYDTRTVDYGAFFVEYLAVGDVMTLPQTGFSHDGYDFAGWYNAPKGAQGNGKRYNEGAVFTGNAYTVVYAAWSPKSFHIILNTDGYEIGNITNGQKESVYYKTDFLLPVPETSSMDLYMFAGWYTGPAGTGQQLTDEYGVSVAPFDATRDLTAYPYYRIDALTFTLQSDNTYAVSKGEKISKVTDLVIPATYNNIPITTILEGAFIGSECDSLQTISFPDTVRLVGHNAFSACSNLRSIEVYKAKDGVYETFYSSSDGVLLYEDMGTTYLEFVPQAKTGELVIPSGVDSIMSQAFNFSKIESVVVPDSVTSIMKNAFYCCWSLKTLTFAPNRSTPLKIDAMALNNCRALETITLPANISESLSTIQSVLNQCGNLQAVVVEEGAAAFSTENGMLTNPEKDTILYCPRGYVGDLSIPRGITAIGNSAFSHCRQITSIEIPVWVTSIGKYAFESCDNVTSITFRGSRAIDLDIGEYAFCYMKRVESITFEGNTTNSMDTGKVRIGANAFCVYGGSKLKTVEIGKGVHVTSIGNNAFSRQNNLRNVTIHEDAYVGTIGDNAFDGCTRLVRFTVPGSVTNIGKYAFNECANLSELQFGVKNATSLAIQESAFSGCTKLTNVLLPDHLESFQANAFNGCNSLKAILVSENNPQYASDENGILYKKQTGSSAYAELLFYPRGLIRENNGIIDNLPTTLTTIGDFAFLSNPDLISITLPQSVTVIGKSAFEGCGNLTTVLFSSSGTDLSVGYRAFHSCTALVNMQLPSYTSHIDASAFESCGFTTFTVPAGISEIHSATFRQCKALKEIIFLCETGLKIGADAGGSASTGVFSGCVALTRVVLPANTTLIGDFTFNACYALKSINLPSSVTTIGNYAFRYCSKLEDVTFGTMTKNGDGTYSTDSMLQTIGAGAFSSCPALKSVIIPASVTYIGSSAFAGESANKPGVLEEVVFERFGTEYLSFGNEVFNYQPNLTAITFPARTESLNGGAPASDYTGAVLIHTLFSGCSSLAEIGIDNDLAGTITQQFSSQDGVLYNADKTALLYCPVANVGTYRNGEATYEIVVPNTVKTVMTYAFLNNTKLQTITFQEFDETNGNYGEQLLTIGNYVTSNLSDYSSNKAYNYATIGSGTIVTINLPAHLAKINSGAFASNSKSPVTIRFSPDTNHIQLEMYAFAFSGANELNIPGTLMSLGSHVFYGNSFLKTVSFTMPAGQTELPQSTFYNCSQLTSYEIPTQIQTIGSSAFDGCASITNIHIPAAVRRIGDYAFHDCTSLTAISLPESVSIIGAHAFDGCKAAREVTIPDSVTAIGNYAFASTNIQSVTIPFNVKGGRLGSYAFYNCASLKTVHFAVGANGKSAISALPDYLFAGCVSLENVDLSAMDLTKIGNATFQDCIKLTGIDFTRFTSLQTIGKNAFSGTGLIHVDLSKTKLTAIENSFSNISTLQTFAFPKDTASISSDAFNEDNALKQITLTSGFTSSMLEAFRTGSAKLIIPDDNRYLAMDAYGVIYDPSFQIIYMANSRAYDLSDYTIPSTVITIGDRAFQGVIMDALIIPEGVTSIAARAFQSAQIPYISIPSTMESIESLAFYLCGVEKLEFANEKDSKLKYIAGFAFEDCTKLEKIVLPDNLNITTTCVFRGCTSLKSITFGAAQKETPEMCLVSCEAVEEIIFQEGLEVIHFMFAGWSNVVGHSTQVKSIVIPASVEALDVFALSSFEKLETVIFAEGSKLRAIGQNAFMHDFSLKNIVNLPTSLSGLGEKAFLNCTSLESLDLGETKIRMIPDNAFENTQSLSTMILPPKVKSIGKNAFLNSGITEIVIPGAVTSIGDSAFENCTKLKTVTFAMDNMLETLGEAYTDETDPAIFRGTTSLETVVLPNFVTTIGDSVFANSGVKTITMSNPTAPSALTTVGDQAFFECGNLAAFDYLQKVTHIGKSAFFRCENLSNAPVYEGLEYIGSMAFGFCNKLPEGYIPASVFELDGNPYGGLDSAKIRLDPGNEMFVIESGNNGGLFLFDSVKSILYGVYGLQGSYTLSQDVTQIMPGAFAGNPVTDVTLHQGITAVVDYAFMGCNRMNVVTLQGDVTAIGDYAFYGCGLSTIDIPDSVTKIGSYAFAYCPNIDHVSIPAGTMRFGNYCFAYCATLSDFTFEEYTGNSIAIMGTHFFYYCPNITKVVLPSRVRNTSEDEKASVGGILASNCYSIPSYTFAGTGIVEAVIPSFTTGCQMRGVFADCKNLERIIFTKRPYSRTITRSWVEGCDKFENFYLNGEVYEGG